MKGDTFSRDQIIDHFLSLNTSIIPELVNIILLYYRLQQ